MNENGAEHPSVFTYIEHIWKYSIEILKDIFNLFTLEIKLAGKSLATILVLVVITALLLLSSWFSLLGALVTWLMSMHLSLILSLFIMSAINLVIAVAIGLYIVRISNNLQFKETRRQLELMRDSHEKSKSKN